MSGPTAPRSHGTPNPATHGPPTDSDPAEAHTAADAIAWLDEQFEHDYAQHLTGQRWTCYNRLTHWAHTEETP